MNNKKTKHRKYKQIVNLFIDNNISRLSKSKFFIVHIGKDPENCPEDTTAVASDRSTESIGSQESNISKLVSFGDFIVFCQ